MALSSRSYKEKHIKKLHENGLLSSFDFESYETCEACLLGKMTKTPFTSFPERASDLLELIHIDVWTNELDY